MDRLIEDGCDRLNFKLDLEEVSKEFIKNPSLFKDTHVVDTLFSIIDFNKFKQLIINNKQPA